MLAEFFACDEFAGAFQQKREDGNGLSLQFELRAVLKHRRIGGRARMFRNGSFVRLGLASIPPNRHKPAQVAHQREEFSPEIDGKNRLT